MTREEEKAAGIEMSDEVRQQVEARDRLVRPLYAELERLRLENEALRTENARCWELLAQAELLVNESAWEFGIDLARGVAAGH